MSNRKVAPTLLVAPLHQNLLRAVPGIAAALVSVLVTSGAFAQEQPDAPEAEPPEPPAATEDAAPPAEAAPAEEATPADAPAEDAAPAEATATEAAGAETAEEASATAPADPVGADPTAEATTPAPIGGGGVTSTGDAAAGASTFGFGDYPNPTDAEQDEETTETGLESTDQNRIFAEDWWAHTRPSLELHGNFRVRAEMYHQFSLGRVDPPSEAYWARPLDDSYIDTNGAIHGASACTPKEGKSAASDSSDPSDANVGCINPTQMGANMRFRIEPAIIISDNLRVRSQIDLFDNLVMGSTSPGNSNYPGSTGYAVSDANRYNSLSAESNGQVSPISGVNTVQDAVSVNRAWAEYETPVGQARFGRMPDHWGLGLVHNAGDDIDGDYQSTVDRIAFFTGLESLSLYAGGAWDFPYEGPTSAAFTAEGGQPYDLAQFDDVSSMNLMLFRRVNPQLERLMLAKGKVVVNGGMYLTFKFQRIANDYSGNSATCNNGAAAIDCVAGEADTGYVRRGYEMWTPDLFAEVKYKKFYAGIEAVTNQGTIQSTATNPGDNNHTDTVDDNDGWRIRQWGFAGEIEQKLVEDRLKLGFYFGYASGDGDVEGLLPPSGGTEEQIGDRSFETFRFHPGYRVDLILNRNILTRVQGSYYFKPMAQYDFIRKDTGMKLGGRAEAIWTRATSFMQAPGHAHDLGIELNGTAYYQSKDGALNDDPELLGGFYAALQYGVLFPLDGMGYQSNQDLPPADSSPRGFNGLKTAQTLRLFLGVAY